MLVHGDAAAVVDPPSPAVGEQRDLDPVGEAGQRLVHGVVDNLLDQVMQAPLAGRAYIHAGALANRLQPLKDPNRACVVRQSGILLLNRTATRALPRGGHPPCPPSGCVFYFTWQYRQTVPVSVSPGGRPVGTLASVSRRCRGGRARRGPARGPA